MDEPLWVPILYRHTGDVGVDGPFDTWNKAKANRRTALAQLNMKEAEVGVPIRAATREEALEKTRKMLDRPRDTSETDP